jgi:poly(3-hydroxybutyrate) depolymerase
MSGHYATLLRATIEALIPDHEVYVTDWKNARDVPADADSFSLDDYADVIITFIEALGPGAHVMGVCQPGVPILMAVSLMAEDKNPATPASMILMGSPIDTRLNPTQPNDYATSRPLSWFQNHVIMRVPPNYPGAGRAVYPGFVQLSGFLAMNLDQHINAHARQFKNLIKGDGDSAAEHSRFYDEYLSVMDLPADYYLDTIERVFQQHLLPKGKMMCRGRPVRPGAITQTGLMTVEGEKDDISGLGQTEAAHLLCASIPPSRHEQYVQRGVGHYGVFNGRRWREEIAPRVAAFVRKNGG